MQQSEQTESEAGNVGSEEWIAGMHDMLAAGLARLQNPPPFHPTPSDRRTQAALQEILSIEGEIKKGPAGNPLVAERADLLRKDVWDRWRAGEGIAAAAPDPLTQAISKLTDVADRQLSLTGALWTGIDLFMGIAVGPVLGAMEPRQRAEVFKRLIPKITFLMPMLSSVTIISGVLLAQRLGTLSLDNLWIMAALIITAILIIQGFGVPLPNEIRIFKQLISPTPDVDRIVKLGMQNARLAGIQGLFQLAIIFVMANLRF